MEKTIENKEELKIYKSSLKINKIIENGFKDILENYERSFNMKLNYYPTEENTFNILKKELKLRLLISLIENETNSTAILTEV